VIYYHWNALSSTVLATDSSGNKVWEENYQPSGKQIKAEKDGRSGVFYTGKHTGRDAGLTYLVARWYDAEIGRFISVYLVTFQLDNPKSFGRYIYANNNLYKYVDTTGEISETARDLVSFAFSLTQYKARPIHN
jgi:RHS repeat-associated protein